MEKFVNEHGLSRSDFQKDLRAALGSEADGTFSYFIEKNCFSWKRRLDDNFTIICGQVTVSEGSSEDFTETVLNNMVKKIVLQEKSIAKFEEINRELKTDYHKAVERLEEATTLKEAWEKKLYGQFVAVLNAKKERIQTLEEAMHLKYENDDVQKTALPAADVEEDPFAADTDVDGDSEPEQHPSTPGPSNRRLLSFDSFESPDSPVMVLPKRMKTNQIGDSGQ